MKHTMIVNFENDLILSISKIVIDHFSANNVTSIQLKLQKHHTINIPTGVTYRYTSEQINEGAKAALNAALASDTSAALFSAMFFIGPRLWKEIKNEPGIKTIEGGNTTFKLPVRNKRGKVVDYENLTGKMIQDERDYRKVFGFLKEALSGERSFRKLNPQELDYYWSVISWDIAEPLYIVSAKSKNYLMDLEEKDGTYKLLWVDVVE